MESWVFTYNSTNILLPGPSETGIVMPKEVKKILYITSSLPALTLTFIYREIFGLRQSGFIVETVSMNRPDPGNVSGEAQNLLRSTHYLDQVSFVTKIGRVVLTMFRRPKAFFRCAGIYFTAKPMKTARDYVRLAYHLIEACYLCVEYRDHGIDHIHAHFVNGPSSIAMFLSILLDRPFSFTMHASLIWLDPVALYNKLDNCKFCASISEYNRDYVVSEYGDRFSIKIEIVRCGIDMGKLVSVERQETSDKDPFVIVGVGQLTERKGFHVLIKACGLLKQRGLEFRCLIVGEGTQRAELQSLIERYRLGQMVTLEGAQPQERIPSYLGGADIFALPCVIADDGWRDGIPVALMEAMAQKIPVVCTNILGLPELIESGENGVLVESEDARALADAIESLMHSEDLRHSLGVRGSGKIESDFNVERSVEKLAALF